MKCRRVDSFCSLSVPDLPALLWLFYLMSKQNAAIKVSWKFGILNSEADVEESPVIEDLYSIKDVRTLQKNPDSAQF